jgi:hypothetical protein
MTLFACHFTPQVWRHAQILVTGAVLARGQRTVTAVLRVMGLSDETRFTTYHRVLNRAVWSARKRSETMLRLLISTFAARGQIVIGGDETIERRRGEKIAATGIYRDPVRSSHSHLYEPAPTRQPGQKGRPRKKGLRKPTLLQIAANPATHWTTHTLRYWYGQLQRSIEIVSDTAVWFHVGKPAVPIRWVIIRDPLHKFKTQALLCTDLSATPLQIVEWFIQRWQMEVAHRDMREHLGVETQRQWSDNAIARTTPVLLGLYSLITLLAHTLAQHRKVIARTAAWYAKPVPTFSDAIAAVCYEVWRCLRFHLSPVNKHIAKLPKAIFNRFAQALCYST